MTREDSVLFCWQEGVAHTTKQRGANNHVQHGFQNEMYFVITCDLFSFGNGLIWNLYI